MRPEVEAALADQFGRPVPLVLVVDGGPAPAGADPSGDGPDDRPSGVAASPAALPAVPATGALRAVEADDADEDLSVFDDDNLEVADIDNSAEARLLQAFPGAEEVV
jgi:hypothetical protein